MKVAIDLKAMTVPEKLDLMEAIWADLSKDDENIPVPDWHAQVLREREERLSRGEERLIDLDEVEKQLRTDLL